MFNGKNILSYFSILILIIFIILTTRNNTIVHKDKKNNSNILIFAIIISFLIMYFNKELGLFILILTFVMYFVLEHYSKKEHFNTSSSDDTFGKAESMNLLLSSQNTAKKISDNFILDIQTQFSTIKNIIQNNKKDLNDLLKKYKSTQIKCKSNFKNTKIPEQVLEHFPRDKVPYIDNVKFNNKNNNYTTEIKDNSNENNYGEPVDNPNYSKEQLKQFGSYFYPLNK